MPTALVARHSGCKELAERQDTSPLERFCALFTDAGVEFMIVGGQAEALMGSPRVTYDFDFCYRRSSENLETSRA